jgi:phosphatidylinositol alpha-mannosyltransferase
VSIGERGVPTSATSAIRTRGQEARRCEEHPALVRDGNDSGSVNIKVCIVVPYDLRFSGGVQKHALNLAQALRRMGDSVDVIGPCSGRAVLSEGVYGFRGVVNLPANGSANQMGLLTFPWTVRRRVRRGHYDVVHLMEPEVPFLPWYANWFAGDSVRIATFHSFGERTVATRLARTWICRPQLRLIDRGIAVSDAAARTARHAWPRPVTIIPNGVDTSVFSPTTFDAAHSSKPGPTRLLFVGHWQDPRKGLPILLEAFDRLRASGVDVTLDIVGHGSPAERRESPHITYHGAVDADSRLARLYHSAEIFIAPSTGQESFGIVLLEAMASGRPIVCSDIEGYRGVVRPDGARLVPPRAVGPLADAIAELVRNQPLRRRMGTFNRQRSLSFDWNLVAGSVRAEYLEALSARRH